MSRSTSKASRTQRRAPSEADPDLYRSDHRFAHRGHGCPCPDHDTDDTTSASEVADSVVSEVSQAASNAADTASNAGQDVTDNDDDDSDKTGLWGLAGLLGLLGLLGLKRRKDTYTSSRPVAADETPRGSTSGHDYDDGAPPARFHRGHRSSGCIERGTGDERWLGKARRERRPARDRRTTEAVRPSELWSTRITSMSIASLASTERRRQRHSHGPVVAFTLTR